MALGVALSACGGGAEDQGLASTPLFSPPAASPAATPLVVTTSTLPEGSRGAFYGPVALFAAGQPGPYQWQVVSGSLPTGLSLSEDGTVLGTPSQTGFSAFEVEVRCGGHTARRTLAIAVETFGVSLDSGDLVYGDARSGHPVDLQAQGFTGTVTFEVVQNGSGGQFTQQNGTTGDCVWVPGTVSAQGAMDIVRIRFGAESVDVQIPVRTDPMAHHLARWGETDVWHVDVDRKHGHHPYALDIHWALAQLGLRNPASTQRTGGVADDLAEQCFRRLLLENLNRIYERNADGSSGILGLAISFVLDAPEGAVVAAPNGYISGGAFRYSRMGVHMGPSGGNLGFALVDTSGNAGHENNTPGPNWSLGVFLQEITPEVKVAYDDYDAEMAANPVNDGDIEHLKTILYGDVSGDARFQTLRYMLNGLARSVAAIVAHEVGHGLGLQHSESPQSVMFWAQTIHDQAQYGLTPGEIQRLRTALPGPGR